MNGWLSTRSSAWQNKVPAITVSFWFVKVMTTTVGESGADFLALTAGWGLSTTTLLMLSVLAVTLGVQVRSKHYTPWLYWCTVLLVSISGTLITDMLTDVFGIGLGITTLAFSVTLATIFSFWYWSEKTLSVHQIVTLKQEMFYWTAILCTFALGTAAGDLGTEDLALGFRDGLVFFGSLLLVSYALCRVGANSVATFWSAYIVTRPFGAALGDLLTQSKANGGIGIGTMWTSAIFLLVIILMVGKAQFSQGSIGKAKNEVNEMN